MTTKSQKIYMVFMFVCIVTLSGILGSVYQDLKHTKETLKRVEQRALKNQNDINAGQGLNIQIFQLEQRVEGVEGWIWNFEDIMFGPLEEESTEDGN